MSSTKPLTDAGGPRKERRASVGFGICIGIGIGTMSSTINRITGTVRQTRRSSRKEFWQDRSAPRSWAKVYEAG